jgi:hypothetical protein
MAQLIYFSRDSQSRDGGTGRRSGLKIRRCLALWGFNSPSRHHDSNKSIFIDCVWSSRRSIMLFSRATAEWHVTDIAFLAKQNL